MVYSKKNRRFMYFPTQRYKQHGKWPVLLKCKDRRERNNWKIHKVIACFNYNANFQSGN